MAETFQVVGGAMACVDLAMKAYKEIERFRLRVKQADEVGEEMASKYGRLTKTINDVHGALDCRQEQLNGQIPSDGEARVWVNIRDSLKGMRKAMRTFKKELEILDNGRDVTKKRKWVDRAIWQLKLNKKAPVFDKLEEAANTRVDELTLSLFSIQIYMHSEANQRHIESNQMQKETAQYIQVLVDRVSSIEASLRKMSSTKRSPTLGVVQPRKTNKAQLQLCLKAAQDVIDKQGPTLQPSEKRRDSSMTDMLPEDDKDSVWADTDGESMFDKPASSRRATVQLAPDELPAVSGLGISSGSRSPKTPNLDDFSDTSDDEFNDLSDDSDDDDSAVADLTDVDDNDEPHERFETAQNSLTTTVTKTTQRTGSVTSTYSNVSCTGIEQHNVDPLIQAFKLKDANSVQRVLSTDTSPRPARKTSITIQRLPILHVAVLKKAGPDIVETLFRSTGVDVNAIEPDEKKTALHWTVKHSLDDHCARLLLAPGINIEIRDKYHNTPLQSALSMSSTQDADVYKIVKMLLEAGARLPTPLPNGMSNTVDTLVKKYEKKRRTSSTSKGANESPLAKAKTAHIERRASDEGSTFKRKFTFGLGRSMSTNN